MNHITTRQPEAVLSFAPAIAAARLADIHDCLTLALDASENRNGYSQAEREARSYVRAALRHTVKMMEVEA